MKIKLRELYTAQNSLKKILTKDIPFKLAYRCARISEKIQSEIKGIETQRIALVKKFGTKDAAGNWTVQNDTPEQAEFQKQFDEVLDIEIELGADLIPQECLEMMQLSMMDVAALTKFIEEKK